MSMSGMAWVQPLIFNQKQQHTFSVSSGLSAHAWVSEVGLCALPCVQPSPSIPLHTG